MKQIFNRNNLSKTIHHIKNGNISFVVSKFKQIINENRKAKEERTGEKKDLFDFMFHQNNNRDKSYKKFISHESLEDTIRTIAFYLPQYHPIEENDENWGRGFTEWTNVSKAIPQFYGHYQPRLPGELGFYDLRLNEVQKRQVELAKNYGIDGFCFHFYWFTARRVLEKPLEAFVADKSLDFPFCINWANENWTRRWDGLEGDVLLEQKYSKEDDIAFIQEVSELFKDQRYIRVNGKPLLMIYRISLFPDIKATVKRWREYCLENGIGEIYLVLTHSFEHENPEEAGFDAAVEFSPNTFSVKVQNAKMHFYNKNYNGMIFDYDDAVSYSLSMKVPAYKKFKTVFPSWDNEARKPGAGTSFVNSSPAKYENWLKKIYRYTIKHFTGDEQLVFVNAWNEWAEGAYLEPDRKFGYAYLESTYKAKAYYKNDQKKIVLISHDAYLHGAQFLALNIAKELFEKHKYDVTIFLNGPGPLSEDFENYGTVYKLYEMNQKSKKSLYDELHTSGVRYAIANTSTVGEIVRDLKHADISSVSLVHEMESVIRQYNLKNSLSLIAEYADKVLFPSKIVENDFKKFVELPDIKAILQPQGLFRGNQYKKNKESARNKLRQELSLEKDAFIVLNIAYGDKRKGLDIFVRTGIEVLKKGEKVHFLWGGHYEASLYEQVIKEIEEEGYAEYFHFTGFLKKIDYYYAGSDLFFLSSREDPFPSVVMDAMYVGVPVLGFKNAGGFDALLKDGQGILVDYLDINKAANAIISVKNEQDRYKRLSVNAEQKIDNDYNFSNYVQKLIDLTNRKNLKVSVIIPNYNYAKYIQERIDSILSQTYPIQEIIFLDDCSSDNSVEKAETILSVSNIPYKIIKNETNSGSVFKQWAKGIQNATGDYIWIAEADDLCEANFLEEVMKGFSVEHTVISYTQSKMIDSDGKILADDYLSYTKDIDDKKWTKDYNISGEEELAASMVIKNTIPNVSAVVFKKRNITPVLDEMIKFKVAGDWFFYVWLLKQGRISYIAKPLNLHRRHNNSITKSLSQQKHFDEIVLMQEYITKKVAVADHIIKKRDKYRKNVKNYLGL